MNSSKGTHNSESSTCHSSPKTTILRHKRRRRNHATKSPASINAARTRLRESTKASAEESPISLLQYWKQDGGDEPDRQRSNDGSIRSNGYGSECGSARTIGADLWHSQLEAAAVSVSGRGGSLGGCVTALLTGPRNMHAKTKYLHTHRHCDKEYDTERRKDRSCKVEPPFMSPNLETITKWDPAGSSSKLALSTYVKPPIISQHFGPISTASALQARLLQARAHIHDLEAKRTSSKKKLHRFLTQLGVENALWQKAERREMRAVVGALKDRLSEEKRYCRTLEVVNSKLNKKLLNAKSTAKECMKVYEEEKKAKELMEEVCNELAKKVGDNKAEVKSLRRETARMYEELEAEKKMLQLAEVWREERVQMKLTEAKLVLSEKYSRVQKLVDDMEGFMRSRRDPTDVMEIKEAESIRQAVGSPRKFDKVKEITRLSRKLGDLFSNNDESPDTEANEGRDIKPYPSPLDCTRGLDSKSCIQDPGFKHSPSDQGHGFSVGVSIQRRHWPAIFGAEHGEDEAKNSCDSGITTELCSSSSSQSKQSKKKMLLKLPSIPGSMPSNSIEGTVVAPGRGSADSYYDNLLVQWSSSPSDSENPYLSQGKTGCIEWPLQRSRLKAKLLEAQVESEKNQFCRVLQQIN